MELSDGLRQQVRLLLPGQDLRRAMLDSRGNHHKTIPARHLGESVANHVDQRNLSIAESLFMVDRLESIGAVRSAAGVRGTGAVLQAFHGIHKCPPDLRHEACHTMPCQLVVDERFPFDLHTAGGRRLNNRYLDRSIQLFARCTYQPAVVNAIDKVLDWSEESDFVFMYIQAVRNVLQGEEPDDAIRDFAAKRQLVLRSLCERIRDEPLTLANAVLLTGAVTSEDGADSADRAELEIILNDKKRLSELQDQRETVVEAYADRDRVMPHALASGELEATIESENWTSEGGSESSQQSAQEE